MNPRIRYSRKDAAEMLSVSLRKFDQLRSEGKLVGRRDGGQILFNHDELVSYANSCESED